MAYVERTTTRAKPFVTQAGYIGFFFERFVSTPEEATILSIGCGTGLVEEQILLDAHGVAPKNLLGFDFSPAMVQEARQAAPHTFIHRHALLTCCITRVQARKRGINAEVGDILEMHSPPGARHPPQRC